MKNPKGTFDAISPSTKIGRNTKVGLYSIIGDPGTKKRPVEIGNNCIVGNHVTIRPGVKIGNDVVIRDYSYIDENARIGNSVSIDPYSHIGENAIIGDNTLILYGAKIFDNTKIGKNSKIGGFVAENTTVGDFVTVFGKLIHSYRDPTHWAGGEEPPKINNFVIIGFDATIIGDISIGHHVYIAAGAIVTKDVPPNSVVYGVNNIVPFKSWKGKLKSSPFWRWKD